jgi:hypothetical protein
MTNRTTEDKITKLKPGEIFVFGSNTSGRHGKGAAKTAMGWGAVYGQGDGLQGHTYGIPTVNASITGKLSLEKIQGYVDNFIEFAKTQPHMTFLVTEIGCGLAGWEVKNIAPLFKEAMNVSNIHLPKKFWRILNHE